MPGRHGTPWVRFHRYLNPVSSGCVEWTGYINRAGYGQFQLRPGKPVRAHRWYYEQMVGPIPEGLVLDHLCLNQRCVNPRHLEPVTLGENTRRWAATITHCVNGHEYTPENTYRSETGWRRCRTCHRDAERERYHRNPKVRDPYAPPALEDGYGDPDSADYCYGKDEDA